MKKFALITLLAVLICGVGLSRAQDDSSDRGTTQPAENTPTKVDPTDKDAVKAAQGKDVILEGTIDKAAWSSSGKVMKATFKGNDQLNVIVFQKKKEAFDKAFNGDLTTTLTGAKVRIHGELKDFHGSPEVVMDDVDQLTIIEPASK